MQQVPGAGRDLADRPDKWAQFRGLSWWQLVLTLLPIVLLPIGGAVGGLVGAAGVLSNLSVARRQLAVPLKVLAMLGVVVAAYLVYFVLVGIFTG